MNGMPRLIMMTTAPSLFIAILSSFVLSGEERQSLSQSVLLS